MSNKKNLLPQYEIEGFDPNECLTVVQEIDGEGQVKETLFMRFQESLAWFLTIYPDGCLNHVFNNLNERKATVTASVYRHVNDARPAATATCTRFFDESINGPYYEQNAITAAYRKALGYLGFGTPLDAHVCEGQKVVNAVEVVEKSEAGVEIPIPRPSARNIESISEEKEKSAEQPVANPAEEKKPETVKMPTTLEDAKQVLVPAGEFKGQTIEVAAQAKGDSYIRWWADKIKSGRYAGSPFAKAVAIYCEFTGC